MRDEPACNATNVILHVSDTVREITGRWISGRSKDLEYYELSLVGVGGAM